MPELPEVETMLRGIAAVVGCRVDLLELPRCLRQPIAILPSPAAVKRAITGQKIVSLRRVGKRVVLCFASGKMLVIEPRMTGLVLLAAPPTLEHLRLRLRLSGGDADELLFWDRRGLGVVRLVSAAEFSTRYGLENLGPDALELSPALLRERLGNSRRAIKVALLDQRAIAGIGNLYASEVLHLARLHPELACDRLRPAQWSRLQAAIDEVLRLAIEHEGSTLSDGTYRNALNQAGSYQNHHRVYDRAGEACPTCSRGKVVRLVQAARSTFYCPSCQRAPRDKPATRPR